MSKYFDNIFFLTLLFSITFPYLKAQTITPKFDELTVASPNCVLQDANGFIWIGAQEGLLRYDGNTLKKYQNIPFDSTSLSANWVTSLAEDKLGNLWVGTIDGLDYFDQRKEQFTQFRIVDKNDSTLSTKSISKIVVNDDGSLWIATSDCGLFIARFNEVGRPEFSHYNLSENISLNDSTNKLQILDLCKDNENCLWIGTMNNGLIKLDISKAEVTYFKNNPTDLTSLSHNTVKSICPDNLGNIWIGTGVESVKNAGGLNKYDRRTGKFVHFRYNPDDPTSLFSDWVNPILIDSKEVMWMSYPDEGIAYIPLTELFSNKKPNFRKSQLKKIFRVKSIYEDRMGNIWFAPTRWILYKYDPHQNPFYWYHHVEGSSNTMSCTGTQCIYFDSDQNIWFGHGNAYLDKYNPTNGIYTTYFLKPDKPTPKGFVWISSICEDTSGYLWIATLNNGLYRMDPRNESFKKIFPDTGDPDGLQTESVWYIMLCKAGKLLLAPVDNDLILFDPQSYNSKIIDLNPGSMELVRISTIFEDRGGTIWLGTFTNGLYKIKIVNNKVQIVEHYVYEQTNKNSLSNNYVCDIIRPDVVDTNALWVATANGMNRFDLGKKAFTHFFEKDGIPDNWVLQLLEDNNGNIWITGKIGIGVYDIIKKKWKSYGLSDGLPFETFGGSRQNNVKGPDGQLFFSGGSGTIGFYPDQIKDNPIIPPVYFTDFNIFNESVKLDTSILFKKVITLSHNQNAFSFEFVALNYTNPEKNQYAYKMEGFHHDWIYSGNEHTAGFTNLEPGKYIFRVKGSNNHGIWNEKGTSILIIITPPWWATIWAYILYAIIILTILYFTWKLQVKRIRVKHDYEMSKFEAEKMHEVDEMKSRFFANISHEFRTPLTLILGLAKKIVDKSKEQTSKEDAGIIRRNAKRLHGLVNQLLDLSKLESGNMTLRTSQLNIIPLLKGLVLSFASFAERKRINLKFNSEVEDIIAYLDKDKVEKIVTNLLTNAFKFTPKGGKIEFSIKKTNANVEISISDTGIGISPDRIDKIFDRFYQVDSSHTREQEGTGLGLPLMKELVELHKGQIRVESREGKGSTFTVIIPLGKEYLKPEEISKVKIEAEEFAPENVELSPEYEEQKIKSDIELLTEEGKLLLLIVEDNTDVRNYIKGNLEEHYRILEAVDGEEGLNQAINQIPDLIISDVMMPKMDGFELCNKLKADERTSHIPIIMLTAKATSQDKIDGYKTGADDYVMKPFNTEVLKARINNLIQQRKRLSDHFKNEGIFEINETEVASVDKTFLKKVIDIINKHISDETFCVDAFADEIAMSRFQLRRKLLSLVGESPSELIRRIRLTKAAKLLEQNFGNISEIAAEVGFNNPANFAHSFKTHFGVSPSEYMNSKKV